MTTKLPKAKLSAITYLRSFGQSIVDSYTGPRAQPAVFPPPSWEIDDEKYKKSKVTSPPSKPSELSSEPPISFARRIGALIDSLPTAAMASATPSSSQALPVQDEGKQGSPVPAEMDKDLVRMLASEEIMNGQPANDKNTDPNRKNTSQHTSNIWNILASLKSTMGLKDSDTQSPPIAVEEEEGGIMMYAPLEPANDSQLSLAESETVLEYVDDPPPSALASTTNHPKPDGNIEGSNATSTSPTTLTPTPPREKHIWVPSTTQLSILATWWGYRLYLPPPVMARLNGTSVEATARAAMLTTALKWLLDRVPLMLIPIQLRPAVKMLKMLSPVVGYVGVFIAWSWDRIKSLDKGACLVSGLVYAELKELNVGNGVVLTATWLLPVALLPMSWDAGDIYGPHLASQQEKDTRPSDSHDTGNKKASDDKGKQKQAKKKSIFPW
jgi:hypothetical protein